MAETDLQVLQCGLFISTERPYLAASPDGILGDETIIEIKCPYSSRHYPITPITVPYLVHDGCGQLALKKSSPFYFQIQTQLYCSRRKFCNLIIFTFKDLKVIYVNREEEFITEMLTKIDNFYNNFFKSAIVNKYLYRDYSTIIK